MTLDEARGEIKRLSTELERHNRLYYVEGNSDISDSDYDIMFRSLELLEEEFPELASPNSPTRRVGGEPIEGFEQRKHFSRMLSIDDVFSEEELTDAYQRLQRLLNLSHVEVVIEPKIDGVAVALHYQRGELAFAVTRGDGVTGDDITENVRTIGNVPLRLPEEAPEWLEVRGEIFMSNDRFAILNQSREEEGLSTFKNPRNATAGTLKLLDSREVAKRPLEFMAHGMGRLDGVAIESILDFQQLISDFGIPVNSPIWVRDSLTGVLEVVRELGVKRRDLPYETDGAVIKVVSREQQLSLGETSRAPRWAAAFKYPPEQKETVIQDITIQVGRTGVLTPVAELDPILVSGTTVSRATLHNQDEIDRKDVRIGDAVLVEKAGEIIPAVVKVLPEKRGDGWRKYDIYEAVGGKCPSCGSEIIRIEGFVAWKCPNPDCPAKSANRIKQFVSRKALDVEGVGNIVAEKLIERGLIHEALDLFSVGVEELAQLNLGTEQNARVLGAKKAESIATTLQRAKKAPLNRWIYALGIPQVGESAARELSRIHEHLSQLKQSEILEELKNLKTGERKEDNALLAPYGIAGEVGPTVARNVGLFFDSPEGERALERLGEIGINPASDNYAPIPAIGEANGLNPIAGKTFVITGTLSSPRDEIKESIQVNGGKVSGSVSKNTDFLLAGEGGGAKRDKAESLGIKVIGEDDLKEMQASIDSAKP
jgi:DNA ligase (NAD+)